MFNKMYVEDVHDVKDVLCNVPYTLEECVNIEFVLVADSAVTGEDGWCVDAIVRRPCDGHPAMTREEMAAALAIVLS